MHDVHFIKLFLRTYLILQRVKRERSIVCTLERRKANWHAHLLRRNCFLKGVIEGRVEGTGRRGRRHKQLLDDVKETTRYWKLKEDALYRTVWRSRFGSGSEPVARENTYCIPSKLHLRTHRCNQLLADILIVLTEFRTA